MQLTYDFMLGRMVTRQSGRQEIDAVRQAVLSARLDGDRLPNFLTGVGASELTVVATTADPLIVSLAAGFDGSGQLDYKKQLTANETVGDLSASRVYYVYLDYDPSTGAVTVGATTAQPVLVGELPEGQGVDEGTLGATLTSKHRAASAASGTVTPGLNWHSYYHPWKCFAQYTSGWRGVLLKVPWRITYQFSEAQTLGAYTIGPRTPNGTTYYPTKHPSAWTLKASNTGAFAGEEVTLDTQTGQTCPPPAERTVYAIGSPASYTYYRFDFTAAGPQAGTTGYLYVGEITLTEATVTPEAGDKFDVRQGIMVDADDDQVYRVYLGELVTDDSGDIEEITNYAIRGYAESSWASLAAGGVVTIDHNMGVIPATLKGQLVLPGRREMQPVLCAGSATTSVQRGTIIGEVDRLQCVVHGGADGLWVPGPSQGTGFSSGMVRVIAKRGW